MLKVSGAGWAGIEQRNRRYKQHTVGASIITIEAIPSLYEGTSKNPVLNIHVLNLELDAAIFRFASIVSNRV